jgi:hypothetical protein
LQLLDQLTFLPLAIVQAAAYINENGITLSDYLSLLVEQEEDVIDLLSEEFEDDWRYRNVKNPVASRMTSKKGRNCCESTVEPRSGPGSGCLELSGGAGQRGLGEPPLFPCVPVLSEYTQLTYHPRVCPLLHSTQCAFIANGRYEAEKSFSQVMETWKRELGVEHPFTLTSMTNLASTFGNEGRWKEAEGLEVETWKRVLEKEHPSTLASIASLALTF